MFLLAVLSDLVQVPPHTFDLPINQSVTNELNKKYANRVIHNLGLAVSVWDLLEIKDGLMKPGTGTAFVETKFRCVIWRPFVGEVLSGWVSECTPEGIKVKLDFFEDIFIPKNYIFENCTYRASESAWVWKPDDETELYIDINEKIRFRIEEEVFVNIKPRISNEPTEEEEEKVPPYSILASCQTEGMGCVSWWD